MCFPSLWGILDVHSIQPNANKVSLCSWVVWRLGKRWLNFGIKVKSKQLLFFFLKKQTWKRYLFSKPTIILNKMKSKADLYKSPNQMQQLTCWNIKWCTDSEAPFTPYHIHYNQLLSLNQTQSSLRMQQMHDQMPGLICLLHSCEELQNYVVQA